LNRVPAGAANCPYDQPDKPANHSQGENQVEDHPDPTKRPETTITTHHILFLPFIDVFTSLFLI
jgi:hypothetical protein